MKAIVGVDLAGEYRVALRLLQRLDFENLELHMVHVDRFAEEGDELQRLAQVEALCTTDSLGSLKTGSGVAVMSRTETHVLEGNKAQKLVEYADSAHADLVCATATHSGVLSSFILGSVCRALAIGAHQSVLIAKPGLPKAGPLKAVFATDHSAYAERCAQRLFSLMPRGISDMTVVSVIQPIYSEALTAEVAEVIVEQDTEYEHELREKNAKLVEQFELYGTLSRSQVRRGYVTQELEATMDETGADLLIVGAQGHGFWNRVVIGSVSLQQVLSERYPFLVLRV